ncbi:unnamed protein product [Symbiodinium necroappetens]|uniref:Uncharacterized protein n=1 Tax=Symbiodinium necroappetens TaxID=1628268 RepID=A0A813AG04_9DINO|nr:unnamed protein product [Symbiodinium necroappetens]
MRWSQAQVSLAASDVWQPSQDENSSSAIQERCHGVCRTEPKVLYLLALPWHAPARRSVAICLTGHLRSGAGQPENVVRPLQRTVLRPLAGAGYDIDIFAVTDAGEECSRTESTLAELDLAALRCVDLEEHDEKKRTAESDWLEFGPRTDWPRGSFLGQMKKVQICDELFAATGKDYSLVSRSRMDVFWHSFPADPVQLELPGVIWLPWRSGEVHAQYIVDSFAIGSYSAMKPYLRVYDEMLDPGNWPLHRSFENSSDGLDTEELWEVTLLKGGILARQHLDICFNLLARKSTDPLLEREDNCRRSVPSHPNGYLLDTKWSAFPYLTLSGFFKFDPLLSARLVHLWFAEFVRIGRPMKVMDLGCGRGLMIERWLQYHPTSIVGVDKMPGLRPVLGNDILELDLTQPMNPRSFTSTRACTFRDGDRDLARLVEAAQAEGLGMHEVFLRVLNCCFQTQCAGLCISLGLAPVSFEQASELRTDDVISLARRNSTDQSRLAWGGRADWAVLLDVASHIPAQGHQQLAANLDAVASEGVVISEPEHLARELDVLLASKGFFRDRHVEDLLLPWAALRGVHEVFSIRVFRRAKMHSRRQTGFLFAKPTDCSLALRFAAQASRCRLGLTFGCSNSEYIWVADGCSGWFARGGRQAGCLSNVENRTGSNWSYGAVKAWQFVECYLPEAPPAAPEPTTLSDEAEGLGIELMETRFLELCEFDEDFTNHHQVKVPLQRLGPGHWESEDIFIGQYPMLQVRLPFDAVVDVSDMQKPTWRARGWHGPVWQQAGRCVAWNLLPFLFYIIRFEIWDASSAEGLARLRSGNSNRTMRASGAPAPTQTDDFALAWEVTDGLVRAIDVRKGGILEVYDHLDPASQWGAGHGGIWRSAGLASKLFRGRADAELKLVDDFAYLLLVVRMSTAYLLGEHVPQSMVDAARVCMTRYQQGPTKPWGFLAVKLLARVMLGDEDRGDRSDEEDTGEDALVTVTDASHQFKLQFSNTPLGRYLHHAASFASSD